MLQELNITDPTPQSYSRSSSMAKFFAKYLRDERDLPFVYLMMKILFIQVPFVACFFIFPNVFNWYAAAGYWIYMLASGFAPFTLMLHNTSHNKLFKQQYDVFNNVIPWLLGMFFGQPPKSYFAHHIGMHHSENNMLDDLSTTIVYKRDSFFGFMHYFLRFFFLGVFELTAYFKRRKMKKLMKYIMRGETVFYLFVIGLSFISFKATFIVFLVPFILIRFLMMAGNWGQHAFVDEQDPENSYKNSITCINSRYNKVAFNDGYHIGHHLRPGMHWTEMSVDFKANMESYAKEKAIIFQKLDFFVVWFLLMTKSYGVLANNYIDLEQRFSNKDEIIAFLKTRTQWKTAA